MSSKGKKKWYYYYDSNSDLECESYYSDSDDQKESETELGLSLEKLNLGPKKKLLVMNLNGLLLHRVTVPWDHCQDQEECTDSGFKSLENKRKPLFFKELNEVFLRIKKGGPYSELNTLLIDDKPYKAFLNPHNTALFPESYKPENRNDKALDPDGELCKYLKGLADAVDVQTYVKDHPFGQPAITSSHQDWNFYLEVKSSLP